MKYLIVGLGNIGPEYELSRHNIGFLTLDKFAGQEDITWSSDRLAFRADFKYKGRHLHLIKPTTYMNLSGRAVSYWLKTLKIAPENLLVVVDDVALPFGTLRMREKGSSAGHNGLKSLEDLLGGQNYARLRFGIGNDFPKGRQVEYVLGNWSQKEIEELPVLMDKAIEMILGFCTIGAHLTMTQYNKGSSK